MLKKFEHIGPLGNFGYLQIKNHVEKNQSIEGFLSTPTLFKKDMVVSSPMLKYGDVLSCKLKYNKKQFINCFITHWINLNYTYLIDVSIMEIQNWVILGI